MKLQDWNIREKIKIKATPGSIDLSCAWVSLYSQSLIVIHVDCRSKYPAVGPRSSHCISIVKSQHTLGTIETDEITEIELELPDGFEIGAAETSRYSIVIFCFRPADQQSPVMIWENS